jgi:hypothetical protein
VHLQTLTDNQLGYDTTARVVSIPLYPKEAHCNRIHSRTIFASSLYPLIRNGLETACLICTTKYGDNVLQEIEEYNNKEDTAKYRQELFVHLKSNPKYLAQEYQRFKAYQKACEAPPTITSFSEEPITTAPDKIPWPLSSMASVMKEYGYTEAQAMDMPINKLISLSYTSQYLRTGECPIMSELEIMGLKAALGQITPEEFMNSQS